MKTYIITIISLICSGGIFGQQVGQYEIGTFLLKGAEVVSVTNGTRVADVLIKDGKIDQLGQDIEDSDATLIDCSGHFIYPGFIDGGTRLGLSEVGSISLTQDYNEIGEFTPHMQALTAVNPNSVSIPVTRVNGVTTVIAKPSGGRFPGTAALIDLAGYTPEQMYAGFKGVVMSFPSTGKRGRWDRRSAEDIKKDEEKALKKLKEIWDQVEVFARIDSAATAQNKEVKGYHPEMDALRPMLLGDIPLMVEVNKSTDIKNAIKWVQEKKIKWVIFTGVAEGWRVAKELAEAKIPVIAGPVLATPGRAHDRYDAPYKNVSVMHNAGVKVAIRTNETENVRNLPFNAGFAATYGLGKEEALKAITIYPAEILGIDDQYGSIEVGKVANLFVSDGDPFEMKSRIKQLFIRGMKVPLESRHTLLNDEFLNRTPGRR